VDGNEGKPAPGASGAEADSGEPPEIHPEAPDGPADGALPRAGEPWRDPGSRQDRPVDPAGDTPAGDPSGWPHEPRDTEDTVADEASPPLAPAAADRDATIVLGGAAAEAAGTPPGGLPIARGDRPEDDTGAGPGQGALPRQADGPVHAGHADGPRRGSGPGRGPTRSPAGPPAAEPDRPDGEDAEDGGLHFRRADRPAGRRRKAMLAAAAVPIAALVLLIVGWAIDAAALSGQVMRNVEVAGQPVGGLGEDSLPEVMGRIADDVATRPVTITSGADVQALVRQGGTYETTAGEIGLALDQRTTAADALDAGRDQPLYARPFSWLRSFFSPREVPVRYTVNESQVTTELLELQGSDVQAPSDPSIELTDQGFVLVPGSPGVSVDAEEVARELPEAAEREPDGTIEVEAGLAEFAPRFSDDEAQRLADRANLMTAEGLVVKAGDRAETRVEAQRLRSWLGPITEDGELGLAINGEAVAAALPELFPDVSSEPQDARITLEGGTPVITPSREGVRCCGDDAPERVWDALQEGAAEVTLEVEITEPSLTTAQAEELGIEQPVGGNHAWRDGAPTTAGPGFTTYHAPGQPRVANIQRIADMVRGAVVLPGESFSVNGHVGERTAVKGFVPAGAIRDGEHVDEIGGGVSQFATTMFNAAYFAGLDITTYQAHSEYFDRYPRGREATMGHPAPDLVIRNNTPYGVLIGTSYTDTSITVTMYSTPYATAEQTDITESDSGNCKVVTTTRTRTYPDGRTQNDTFRATYRPGEGEFC
jgi:vancomycin resistance protein YoaR